MFSVPVPFAPHVQQNIISKSKPNSDSKSISSENTIKQKVIKKDLVKSENVSKFAKRANRILSAYCLFDKVTDNVDKGSMDGKDIYDYASWAVGAFGGIAGATASFFTELYRQAGEWFIEKVQDFNSSVEKNKVDIMSNMYYTGSPF